MASVETLVQTVLKGQSASGAFHSTVFINGQGESDWNGFTTALTLRALAAVPGGAQLEEARERALDFLESCESPDRRGAYGFWPRHARPAWGIGMVEDADDTAVIGLELYRHGRLSLHDIRRIVIKVLLPHRVDGVFQTWLHSGVHPNPIDYCLNVNVLALMAAAGVTHLPAYAETCGMIEHGVRSAGCCWSKISSLTPYYPDPSDLVTVLTHAVQSGASECKPALSIFDEFAPYTFPATKKIFSSSDAKVYWVSETLQAAGRRCS